MLREILTGDVAERPAPDAAGHRGGARAVVVRHDSATEPDLARLYAQIGGLWLPGGDHPLIAAGTPYLRAGTYFVARALRDGDLAIGGNCLGLEALLVAAAGKDVTSAPANAIDVNVNISLTDVASRAWLFDEIDPRIFETGAVSYMHHGFGVPVDTFRATPALVAAFDLLATARSLGGKLLHVPRLLRRILATQQRLDCQEAARTHGMLVLTSPAC